jgi:hypothetical protein
MKVPCLLTALCLMLFAVGAADNVPSFYVRGVIAGIETPGSLGAPQTAYGLRKDRQDLIHALIKLAQREPTEQLVGPDLDPKYNAVTLLGDLRAEEAVQPLLGQLDYRVVIDIGTYSETGGYGPAHPAALALAKIGKPASTEALSMLVDTSDPEKAGALVWVIAHVEGAELAKYLIAQRKAYCSGGPQSGNLTRALGLVDEMAGK